MYKCTPHKHSHLRWFAYILCSSVLWFVPTKALAASCEDYTATPPFLTTTIKPNVLFMLDNSGSMKNPVYDQGASYNKDCTTTAGTGYNPSKTYFGMFDSGKKYTYDPTIPVDSSSYFGAGAPYSIVDSSNNPAIDTTSTGAFTEDTSDPGCTPAAGTNCWDGNFLNWLVTRRTDAARKVLIGGKTENRSGYEYKGAGNGTFWKIVGNNEPSDRDICKTDTNLGNYTPIPNSTRVLIHSPADKGEIQSSYDPYAKILPIDNFNITNVDGDVIGEVMNIKVSSDPLSITSINKYIHPIIVAAPPENGEDPTTVRIINNSSPNSYATFDIKLQDWTANPLYDADNDPAHPKEPITYVILERGVHLLPKSGGGTLKIVADETLLEEDNVKFNTLKYPTTLPHTSLNNPVVIASISSENDSTPVTTRIQGVTNTEFKIALQRAQADTHNHPKETVSFMAMEQGVTTGSLRLAAATAVDSIDRTFKTVTFPASISAGAFLAAMQTFNDSDTANLRFRNFTTSSVDLKVEEEQSYEENTVHTAEDVGFIAFEIPEPSASYNIALITDEEPKGLVHSIESKVRTGISFYRYQKTDQDKNPDDPEINGLETSLYDGEWAHGGTLRLAIPSNPFLKKNNDIPSYRYIDTPVKAATSTIVDAIEHYPLVWGTTPLAENLYEVGRYFSQIPPYYDDKPTIGSETNYLVYDKDAPASDPASDTIWDPYIYTMDGITKKIRCAKSYVIILTDGYPYRDDNVPAEIVGTSAVDNDDYDTDGVYNSNRNDNDCFDDSFDGNKCQDNLDDVAKYLYEDTLAGDFRDLRPTDPDLPLRQHLEVYTVAFGSSTIPDILVDTANNANGEAYAAEDGEELTVALTSAITSILKRTSAGSSISVLSERATLGSLINQALFFPSKTFTDGTDSYDVDWTGALNGYWFYNSRTISNIRENNTDPLGYYTLDIFDDKIIDFKIDAEGSLRIDYYKAINEGSHNDGALDPNSGPGDTAGPEGTYDSIDDVHRVFEAGEILKDRTVDADPNLIADSGRRYIYAVTEVGTAAEFVQSNFASFDSLFNLTPTSTPECLGETDTPAHKETASKNLISYIRGASDNFTSQANITQKCRNRQVDSTGNLWKLGDIIYSTPQPVNYDTGSDKFSLLFTGANDGMLHAFKLGRLRKDKASTGQAVALCDSNTGDCTNNEIGEEAWAFMPRNAMPYLQFLADPEYKHIYTVDLPPYIIETSDKKILIGGMRFGGATGCTYEQGNSSYWCGDTNKDGIIDVDPDGNPLQAVPPDISPENVTAASPGLSSYFALDITDPYNPIFLWEFTDPSMGYSYSGPAVISRQIGNINQKYVMFLSGPLNAKGYTTAGQDLKIYILKLSPADFTIQEVFKLDGNDEDGFVKESALSNLDSAFGGRLFTNGIDYNNDGSTDAVFFGVNWLASNDWKGNVFLVAPTNDDPITDPGGRSETTSWEFGKMFNQGQAPITSKIEHGLCYENNYLYFGSGRWFYKTDTPGQNPNDTNSLWGIEIDNCLKNLSDNDDRTKCTSTLNRAHNSHLADDLCENDGTLNQDNEVSWQMSNMAANTGGDFFMERTITDPTYYSNIAFFTTMQPSSDLCDFGGRTRIWAFNCRTGHNMFDGCSGVTTTPPPASLLLQLSGGNIEDARLNESKFSEEDNYTTGWFKGVPPESGTPIVPYSGKFNGEILLWIER
ncbi:pilus assembly protein [Desulfopila aestuarii]|uniref:Type IV pilus assembly protein PilY1 n=1 Tax=Desulfopila aestuarii DSM 18488 TaxID=1121416 RepID=A0A1M7Y1L9_9BACT|nr:hypothetical protein [Desulfopila aestuarii]SHO45715.1 type IV pilus assembly protein PilY1 [Desulfopila aestuarii DSM 18488]